MRALCLEPPCLGDVPLSPVISGLSLVPLVAQSVLGKTCALGKEPGEVLQQGGEYQPSLWALVVVKVSLGLPGLAWGR